MTFGPETCTIDDLVHVLRGSGVIGGSTECRIRFRWSRGHEFKEFIKQHPDYFERPIASAGGRKVTCLMCIAEDTNA